MGKPRQKAEPACEAGAPAWMATFSDMVTLLLTFFIMLMAMANFEDVGRMQAVLESIKTALGVGGFNTQVIGVDDQPQQQIAEIEKPDQWMPIVSELREALSKHLSDNLVRMTRQRTEVRITFDDSVLFAPGSAEVHPAAYSMLTDIAEILARHPVTVIAEGHTDASGEVEKNWDLSARRAAAVIAILQDRGGLDGRKLEARGFGQWRPVSGAAQGVNAEDRRVELVIRSDDRSGLQTIEEIDRRFGGQGG